MLVDKYPLGELGTALPPRQLLISVHLPHRPEFTIDIDLRKEIVREVNRCGTDVQRALDRVFKFSALGRDNDTNDALHIKLKRQWFKLEWRFGHRSHMKEVRADLAAATQRLAAYLVVSNADGIQGLNASISSQLNAMTAQICSSFLEQFAAAAVRDAELAHTMHGNAAALGELRLASRRPFPNLVGSRDTALNGLDSSKAAVAALLCVMLFTTRDTSRPTDFALLLAAFAILMCSMARDSLTMVSDVKYTQSNSITLNDAMGRRLVLPLELCETPELFHVTLVNLFSRTNGRWFVDAHRYKLKRDNGRTIDNNYDRKMQPGTELVMFILVQQVRTSVDAGYDTIQCPLCFANHTVKPYFPTVRTRLCSGCGTEFLARTGSLKRLEGSADNAQSAPQNIEHDVNDLGRFPRARPSSVSGTQHSSSTPPRSQRVDSSGSRDALPDTSNKAELLSSWRDQVQCFTRFSIYSRQPSLSHFSCHALPKDYSGSELHEATVNGHYELVARLLHRGADIDLPLVPGYTALHSASTHGHIRIVELLLDHGASIDASTEDNITPLAWAVQHLQIETASLLVARGAMVDASDALRAAVLYVAADVDNVDIMRWLLRLGLDANTPFRGETALHAAVSCERRESVEVLLRNGADPTLRSKTGKTPLCIAAKSKDVEIFELLCVSGGMANYALPSASGNDIGQLLRCAVLGGSPVIVATVLQHTGPDLNARFGDDSTPLSLASEHGNAEVVELLLVQGADPNVEALPAREILVGWEIKEGAWKPLHAAAYDGHAKCIEVLLQHGADPNARTEYGDTALSLALEGKRMDLEDWLNARCFNEVFDILVSSGAVVDERSSLLLEEIALLEGSLKNQSSGFAVPGAWCEEAGQDQD
ncbi:ankyrin [Peniophora sp. CONT]|nr:ankyrin [Peniophora sp. CONT]